MTAEEPLVVVDDDQVRVTTWSFGRVGDTTGPHVHEYARSWCPSRWGLHQHQRRWRLPRLTQQAGLPYRGIVGTAHSVANAAGAPAVFVEQRTNVTDVALP